VIQHPDFESRPDPSYGGPTLGAPDADAVDALIEAEFDLERVPAAIRPRAAAAAKLFERLDALPDAAEESDLDALVDATLLRIDREEELRESSLQIETRAIARQRLRISDFVGIAAVLLLAVSIAVPLSNHVRTTRGIEACGNGQRNFGGAMEAFARDHDGLMPFNASLLPDFGGLFPTDGDYRHADHFKQLVDGGYCDDAACMGCPNHPAAGGMWSYRVPADAADRRLDLSPRRVIVGDRNPVIELVLRGRRVRLEMCSPEHDDRGQNLLHSDLSTEFARQATVTSRDGRPDNIWLPPDGQAAIGRPVSGSTDDIFLLN
jgi:hypothetical protein